MEEPQPPQMEDRPVHAPPAAYADQPPRPGVISRKSPRIAAFFALFPGLGHIYNGLYQRGIVFFGLTLMTLFIGIEADFPPAGFLVAFIWLFNLMDAYRQAVLINHGYATDLGLSDRPQPVLKPGQGALLLGAGLFAVGFLELLTHLGLWDWRWLEEHWYVIPMALGAWLVSATLRRRREEEAPSELL